MSPLSNEISGQPLIICLGTAKICQAHTTRSLNLFADDEHFTATPSLRGEVLDFLVRQCSDRVSPHSLLSCLAHLTFAIARFDTNDRPFEPMVDHTGSTLKVDNA